MNETTLSETNLKMTRRLAAPPQRVFDAWTTQAAIERWFCPSPEMHVKVHHFDAREGGRYRLDMVHPTDGPFELEGTFRVLEPPNRLVMTWRWIGPEAGDESLLTVELEEDDGGTLLTLTHERFPDRAATELHAEGWEGCLAQLEAHL